MNIFVNLLIALTFICAGGIVFCVVVDKLIERRKEKIWNETIQRWIDNEPEER